MPIDLERHGPVAVITLNRPDALNALSVEMLDDLEARMGEVDADPRVRAVVLTGAGERAFCAGADIAGLSAMSPAQAGAFAEQGQRVFDRIEGQATPVVAAVNGFALGGGCELALACDIRVAADTARLGQPEVTLGVVPAWGGARRMSRVAGAGVAKDLILTGRLMSADEALRTGLVTELHPGDRLRDAAMATAGRIAANATGAVAAAKHLCNLAVGAESPQNQARAEADRFAHAFTTDDRREGTDAILEKRPPRFAGHETAEG